MQKSKKSNVSIKKEKENQSKTKAGVNENNMKEKLGNNIKGKIIFGRSDTAKLKSANISVDGYFEYNKKLYLVEIDSENQAKLLAGQYILIDCLYDTSNNEVTKKYSLDKVVFLVLHCHKDYKPIRTIKNLEVIKDKCKCKLEYQVFHTDDFKDFDELKNLISPPQAN